MIAATISFLLLGIVLRSGSAAPAGPVTDAAFQTVLLAGMVAYNVSFVLAAIVLLWTAWAWRRRTPALSLLLAFTVAVVLLPLPNAGALRAVLPAALAVALGAHAWAATRRSSRSASRRELRWGFAMLDAVTILYTAVAWAHLTMFGTAVAAGLAGLMAVAVAIVAPFALGCAFDRRSLLLAVASSVVFTIVAVASPLVPLIAMWAVSLSMSLPLPLYVLGVGTLVYAASERMRATGTRGGIAGLWLLVLAGIGLRTTQEVLLVAVGLLWLFTRSPFPQPGTATDLGGIATGSPSPPPETRNRRTHALPPP